MVSPPGGGGMAGWGYPRGEEEEPHGCECEVIRKGTPHSLMRVSVTLFDPFLERSSATGKTEYAAKDLSYLNAEEALARTHKALPERLGL